MNFDLEYYLDKSLPHIKKWSLSVICIPFCWVLAEQFWMALKWEISFAWLYPYPFFLSPFFFLIDNFLLIVHEAGHTFFGIFGSRFIQILGGTLFEILLPFSVTVFGWYKRKRFVAQIGLLMTGYAWIESSAYAADAFSRRMPLIGNLPKSAHDFYNMFSITGSMDHYMTISWLMYSIGIITLLLFFFWPLLERKEYAQTNIKLDL